MSFSCKVLWKFYDNLISSGTKIAFLIHGKAVMFYDNLISSGTKIDMGKIQDTTLFYDNLISSGTKITREKSLWME